jgi:hypothetical protein
MFFWRFYHILDQCHVVVVGLLFFKDFGLLSFLIWVWRTTIHVGTTVLLQLGDTNVDVFNFLCTLHTVLSCWLAQRMLAVEGLNIKVGPVRFLLYEVVIYRNFHFLKCLLHFLNLFFSHCKILWTRPFQFSVFSRIQVFWVRSFKGKIATRAGAGNPKNRLPAFLLRALVTIIWKTYYRRSWSQRLGGLRPIPWVCFDRTKVTWSRFFGTLMGLCLSSLGWGILHSSFELTCFQDLLVSLRDWNWDVGLEVFELAQK